MMTSRPSSSSTDLLARLALSLLLGACRIQVGGAQEATPAIAGDTLRLRCDEVPVLVHRERESIEVPVERLLTSGEDLLLATRTGALLRFQGPGRAAVPVLGRGKDYDAREDVVVRLSPEQVDFFRYRDGSASPARHPLPAAGSDLSIAMGPSSLYLHSPAHPSNVLVVERDRRTGDSRAAFLPVQRNLLRLLLTDADELLRDTGYVRAIDEGFAFVPMVRDPIEIFARRRTTLFLANGDEGSIRTSSSAVVRSDHPCPTCTEHREVETRQEIRRLYADVAVGRGSLWILRLDPPGSPAAVLLRYALDERRVVAWRLAGLESPPRALAVWGARLVVADDGHLHLYDLPSTEGAGTCNP